jgi:hypothetical protein
LPVVDDVGAAVHRLDRCAKYHHNASWEGDSQAVTRSVVPQ